MERARSTCHPPRRVWCVLASLAMHAVALAVIIILARKGVI